MDSEWIGLDSERVRSDSEQIRAWNLLGLNFDENFFSLFCVKNLELLSVGLHLELMELSGGAVGVDEAVHQ